MSGVYTVAGLRVVRELPPEQWTCYSAVAGTEQLPMDNADQAIDFVTNDATGDLSNDDPPMQCIGLALACVHVGDVPIVGDLTRAADRIFDGQVAAEQRRARNNPVDMFTVCGIDRRTFTTWSYGVRARSWLLAWVYACELAEDAGSDPLTARIHPGGHPRVGGYDYADRLATDTNMMRLVVTDVWGQIWTEDLHRSEGVD